MKGPMFALRLRTAKERAAINRAARKTGERPTQWARRVLLEAAGMSANEPPEAEGARRMARGEPNPWRPEPDTVVDVIANDDPSRST